jgi:uncharacterized membrane protein YphA (DoxX/SURF4 family)
MDSSTGQPGEAIMTKAERQSSFEAPATGAAILMAGAGLLILLGIVFQLAELGYGHINANNFWLFSVLASNVWGMVSTHLNVPALTEMLRFWPLLLVCSGFAMLAALKPGSRKVVGAASGKGNTYGQ